MGKGINMYGPYGQIINTKSGYGSAGASKKKGAFKGFDAVSGSPISDIDFHNATLRQRSRMLYMAAPIATSAIRTNRTNVVGCGLTLKSRISAQTLGITSEETEELERKIEEEFALWADDKYACDATGVNDFYALQQLALTSWLLSGDAFVLRKYRDPDNLRPYSLRIHVIEADRVCTPAQDNAGRNTSVAIIDGVSMHSTLHGTEGMYKKNRVHDGVEVDKDNMVVAYHICSQHPETNAYFGEKPVWRRVEAYSKETGLPNVIQIMDTERPNQYRGVPYLAQAMEPLLQSRRYTESELMAAVIESFFTTFIKTESNANENPFNSTVPENERVSYDPEAYEMGPGQIQVMNPGESIETADPRRPASGFEPFLKAVSTQVGAALEIPADLLLKSFNASYSASRAALLEAWKAFKMRRTWFVSDFCKPVYASWFSEAVALGRIKAPGFFDDPLIRAAWLGAEWVGPSQGQLDPVKEVNAEILAMSAGLTTHEQATVRLNGGSFDRNIEQLARENKILQDAGIQQVAVTEIEENYNGDKEKKEDN
jgi:lambda family phage portal protein